MFVRVVAKLPFFIIGTGVAIRLQRGMQQIDVTVIT